MAAFVTTRFLLVNRYGPPDLSATSQLLSDLALHLASRGVHVEIIASRQRYDDPEVRLAKRETIGGVSVRRPWTTHFGRATLMGRALDYATFYWSAAWTVLCTARRGDVVIVKTDPPMLASVVAPIARMRGAYVVNWLQDVFPEVAQALGMPGARRGLVAWLARWRTRSLGRADANVVIGERMRDVLVTLGVAAESVHVIHNWADNNLAPLAHADNPLRAQWHLADKFVVGYSGNLGRAHEFATLLGAAELLRAEPSIVFLFIGAGHQMGPLRRDVESRGLTAAFRFHDYQPREMLSRSLGVADLHWISLRPELEGLIVPSKLYGILAAARPVLMVGDPDGEVGRVVSAEACGMVVPVGDAKGLALAIRTLHSDPGLRGHMGARARALYDDRYTPSSALDRWLAVLSKLPAPTSRAQLPHPP